MKETVRLREQVNTNGVRSLYLDYASNGKRIREFLKIYLIEEKTRKDKQENESKLAIAHAIKVRRTNELKNNALGLKEYKTGMSVYEYIDKCRDIMRINSSKHYVESINKLINTLRAFRGDNIMFHQISKQFLMDYIVFLKTEFVARGGKRLSKSSVEAYWTLLVVILNRAVKDEIIESNPAHKIHINDRPKREQSKRSYLTLEEIKLLIDTKCDNEDVHNTFLFSCFCGLRYSDIKSLKWEHIAMLDDGSMRIEFRQQKTNELQYAPLSENAISYLPPRGDNNDYIFYVPHPSTTEKHLLRWRERAGLKKHVTFHTARHTYATMLLTYGADLYTVSKLLGHQSIKTTQIYAKVIDKNKQAAVKLIPKLE